MRLIDADALVTEIIENPPVYNANRVVDVINNQPTIGGWITITDEEAEAIIAFVKNHEREEIPDDVWDVCMRLCDLTERG